MILAADIGATHTRIGLFTEDLRLLKMCTIPTERGSDPLGIPNSIISAAEGLIEDLRGITAFGISSIGPLDAQRGVLTFPVNVEARNVPLIARLRDWLEVDYYLINDCNAAAYAEWRQAGEGRVDSLVFITFSTGIGGGAIINGRLLLGKDGNAAEIGHIVVDYSGYMTCGCGGGGHWEAYSSGLNITHFAERLLCDNLLRRGTALEERLMRGDLDATGIFELYRMGDPAATQLLERVAVINAAGIASTVNCYDPEEVLVGGALALNNREYFRRLVFGRAESFTIVRPPTIEFARLRELSPLTGAACVAVDRVDEAKVRG